MKLPFNDRFEIFADTRGINFEYRDGTIDTLLPASTRLALTRPFIKYVLPFAILAAIISNKNND